MARKFLASSLLLLLLTGCNAPDPMGDDSPPVETEGLEGLRIETIGYYPDRPEVIGYVARPDGDGPYPALILIHEFWGLNDNMRWYAEQFAKQGYLALAVDLYGQSTEDPEKARAYATVVRENVDEAFKNLGAAVDYLRSRPDVAQDRIASVGWCFGGGWSYQMAKNDLGVKASVMYYGQFAPEDDLTMMKSHIIGHFGDQDQVIAVEDVKAFQAKLQTLSGEHQIFIYENVGHGFARELTTDSAKQAWERTLEFLKKNL